MTVTINCDRCGKLVTHSDHPVCRLEFGANIEKKGERADNLRLDLCGTCQDDLRDAMCDVGDVEWANPTAYGRLLPKEDA